MYAAERRAALTERLGRDGRVSVGDAARDLGVSGETIRRDLDALERHGLVRRVHGGAVARSAVQATELGLSDREERSGREKLRIAAAAAEHLPADGGTLLVDAGTSTAALVEQLPVGSSLTVVTHGTVVAAMLSRREDVDLVVVGGRVRGRTAAAVGSEVVSTYDRLRADVAFLGANGVSAERGLTTPDFDEAAVKRALVGAARRSIVLADSSKLDTEYLVTFAGLDAIDLLITDDGADPAHVARLRDAGLEVQLA